MLRKNLPIIIVILLALLLMAFVIWVFDRRIEKIKEKEKPISFLQPSSHNNRHSL
jgi:hypothetical protein